MAGNKEEFMVRFDLDVSSAISNANRLSQSLGNVVGSLNQTNAALGKTQAAQTNATGATTAATKSMQNSVVAANSTTRSLQNLSTTRYALYDVAYALGAVGAILVGLPTLVYGTSIAMERQFANVIRTSQVTGDSIATLRNNFIELASSLPVSFDSLTQIGTLAGQLGISANNVAEFTSVVARFGAVSDLSVEQAATAFGRLRALLPDVADGTFSMEQLASAILKVGVNSVATEGEIVNVAVQLSSMAGYAGLTASELIGLSAALASVGVKPELARGTITRLFVNMGRAVTDAGNRLDTFARVSGVSSATFAAAFGTNKFGPIFQSFIEGLGKIQSSGDDVVATLDQLGIKSVRDVPALTRLASGYSSTGEAGKILAENIANANEEIQKGGELSRQYAIIGSTVSAKLQILTNNFQNLSYVIGQGGGVFGGALDALNGMLVTLTKISQNPWLSGFVQVGLVISALIGFLALMGAGLAVVAAGTIAVNQALFGMAGSAGTAGVGIKALSANLVALGVSAKAVAGTLAVLRGGLIGVAALASAGVAFGLQQGITQLGNAVQDGATRLLGGSTDIEESIKRINASGSLTQGGFLSFVSDFQRGVVGMGLSSDLLSGDMNKVDDALTKLAQSGQIAEVNRQLESFAKANNTTVDQVLSKYPNLRAQLELTAGQSGTTSKALLEQADATEAAANRAQQLADYLSFSSDEYADFVKNIQTGSSAFVGVKKAITDLQDTAKKNAEAQAKATESTKDSWQDYYDGVSVNIKDVIGELDKQTAAQAAWATDLSTLTSRGASAFVSAIAAMGPEGAAVAKQAVNLTNDELLKLEEQARLAGFLASKAYADSFAANDQYLVTVMEAGGIEAVRGVIAAQAEEAQTGVPGAVATFVNTWNSTYGNNPISMPVDADTYPADKALRGVYNRWNGTTVTFRASTSGPGPGGGGGGWASGGPIYGPGTGTSDSIPARLSHGEYVIRASSVRKYGMGMFDALNRGVARFASGGPVYRGNSQPMSIGRQDAGVNVSIVQNNPVTRDPLRQLRETSENLAAGIWGR